MDIMIFCISVGKDFLPQRMNIWEGDFPGENTLEDGYLGKYKFFQIYLLLYYNGQYVVYNAFLDYNF